MTGLLARDLMTPDVVTVPPETPVMAMARLLSDRGISAVPVVDKDSKVLGIVTEADLIRRLAAEEDKPASWFGSLFSDPASQAERYARTHGPFRSADVAARLGTGVAPIDRAISTAGGVALAAVDEHLMLTALPGVFAAGEMLDWEAPTGGYLLQACFATGVAAAEGVMRRLNG